MGYDNAKSYFVSGAWNPADGNFDVLNEETPKGELSPITGTDQ